MNEKLEKLYRTMSLIETKGESTKIMCSCLRYLEDLIKEASSSESVKED